MANLVLAFAELLAGAVVVDAALKGDSIANVVRGQATSHPVDFTGGTAATATSAFGEAGAAATAVAAAAGSVPETTSANAPAKAVAMLATANALVGAPYSKANHAGAFSQSTQTIKKLGTDCSGFVSVVLGRSGLLSAAQTTQTLPSQPGILAGPGKFVTIWDRDTGAVDNEHVIINIMGNWFESGGNAADNTSRNGGVGQMTDADAKAELGGGGFTALHPQGL